MEQATKSERNLVQAAKKKAAGEAHEISADLARTLEALQANDLQIIEQGRQLQRLNSRFEIALNNMARGLSMFDTNQCLIVCNKMYREIYQLPLELTQPGTTLAEIVRYHVWRETGVDDDKAIQKERIWIEHHIAQLRRGRSFTHTQHLNNGRIVLVTNQPLPEGGWVDIQEDVTEKYNYERMLEERVVNKTRELAEQAEELRRSNRELERFAYVASHDLQEPLRMVASYTQLLGRRYAGKLDSDADDFIAFAIDGVSRMRILIDDLLMYSRVSTTGRDFAPTDCDAVVDSALANLSVALNESAAIVTRDALPTIVADRSQLVQLFQNLIGNAIKFRGGNTPRICVGAERVTEGWQFSIRDNGIGIDPKYIEQLFVIFKRLHARSEYPGTGIGLAICKKIVERHRGKIWVNSKLGEGSTFSFIVPDHACRSAKTAKGDPTYDAVTSYGTGRARQ
jgi:signal transduction histidine kinase